LFTQEVIETDLRLGNEFAEGGLSVIFELAETQRFLYKKYRNPAGLNTERQLWLQWHARFFHLRPPAVQSYMLERFSWPVSSVYGASGSLVGEVIGRAPEQFLAKLFSGETRARDFSYLIFEDRARQAGITPIGLREKLTILREFAVSLAWLQSNQMVHEDLAPQNILWSANDGGSAFIIDCDSVAGVAEEPAKAPLALTPDWTDPRVVAGQIGRPDYASMSYALGLLIARTLGSPYWSPGDTDRDLLTDGVPAALFKLLKVTISEGERRPSLSEWLEALDESIEQADPNTLAPVKPPVAPPPLKKGGLSFATKERIAFAVGVALGGLGAFEAIGRWL
jgi:serine/threonine protein kinase